MSDCELLKAAAKAAGLTYDPGVMVKTGHMLVVGGNTERPFFWNPLADDGDALRLAVRKRFHVCIFAASYVEGINTPGFVEVWRERDSDPLHTEYVKDSDYEAATRRAIVRAAAEIGGRDE